jgi:hypothetical protein
MHPVTQKPKKSRSIAFTPSPFLSCFGVTLLWSPYRWAEVGCPGGTFGKGEPCSAHDWEHLLPVYKVEMS